MHVYTRVYIYTLIDVYSIGLWNLSQLQKITLIFVGKLKNKWSDGPGCLKNIAPPQA